MPLPNLAWSHALTSIFCLLSILHSALSAHHTYVSIHNLTPYSFELQGFDNTQTIYSNDVWTFPTSINPGSADQGEIYLHVTPINSGIQSNYSVVSPDGSTRYGTFSIWLDVSSGSPSLWARLNGFSADNLPDGQAFELGFREQETGAQQWTPFILAGGIGSTSFTATYPSDSWMHDNLGALGCRTLREICIPGSHDSGMSEIHKLSGFATSYATKAQSLSISDQLYAGVRYFDIRPVIDGGHYGTQHFTGFNGADGRSLQNIIWDINNFTESHAELIILNIDGTVNRDKGFASFDQDDWDGLIARMSEINDLYTRDCSNGCDLSNITLNDYIGDGTAAVILVNSDSTKHHTLADSSGYSVGWYDASALSITGKYANSISSDDMLQKQYSMMAELRTSSTDLPFQLWWTLTTGANPDGILAWADGIATLMFAAPPPDDPNDITTTPRGILQHTTPQSYPNILTVDDVQDNNMRLQTSFAIGLSRLYATCS